MDSASHRKKSSHSHNNAKKVERSQDHPSQVTSKWQNWCHLFAKFDGPVMCVCSTQRFTEFDGLEFDGLDILSHSYSWDPSCSFFHLTWRTSFHTGKSTQVNLRQGSILANQNKLNLQRSQRSHAWPTPVNALSLSAFKGNKMPCTSTNWNSLGWG